MNLFHLHVSHLFFYLMQICIDIKINPVYCDLFRVPVSISFNTAISQNYFD